MIKIRVDRVTRSLLWWLLFLIPFTGLRGLSFLGEIKGEGHVYPLLVLVAVFFLYLVKYPERSGFYIKLQFLIFIVLLLSYFLAGGYDVGYFKGASGVRRFFTQYFVLFFYTTLAFSIFIMTRSISLDEFYQVICSAFVSSFVVVVIFSVFEVPYVLGMDFTKPILDMYSSVFRDPEYYDYLRRLRSVSFEAPSFGMYAATLFTVFLSARSTLFSKKSVCMLFILALVLLSYSRAAFVLIFAVLLVYIYMQNMGRGLTKNISSVFFAVFGLLLVYIADEIGGGYIHAAIVAKAESMSIDTADSYHLASNLGRWGSQTAAVDLGFDFFWTGVGLGQGGFYLPDYYPDWAFASFQVRNWSNPVDPLWPPIFSIYTRLFSEVGVFGISAFVIFNAYLISKLRFVLLNVEDENLVFHARNGMLFIILSLLVFAQFGSFRLAFYWVSLAYVSRIIWEVRLYGKG